MAEFFLGTHKAHFLALTDFQHVPLFVSHNTLKGRATLPRAVTDWAEDSGGFMQLKLHGAWRVTAEQYVQDVRRHAVEVGRLRWAAIQDWMCEPFMLQRTGLPMAEHQRRTVQSLDTLRSLAPELPWAPVLQGWQRDDYLRCWEMYEAAGFNLLAESVVGIGSICRRQHTDEAEAIIRELHGMGLKLHGFGFKTRGLLRVKDCLASADSLAWSFDARRSPPLPGHPHKSCANCKDWALLWHQKLLRKMYPEIAEFL